MALRQALVACLVLLAAALPAAAAARTPLSPGQGTAGHFDGRARTPLSPGQGTAGHFDGQARTVHFRGQQVQVPAGWPVVRLAAHPRMCVRLDRRAVYLGSPSAHQRCPADAIGRRRAILVGRGSRAGESHAAGARAASGGARASAAPTARLSAASEFTGLGFDACTAPSPGAMATWEARSPYRAIGVYIGGLNRGCSQPNLTAGWVSEQTAAGWHLIPTYVGLQSPTSSCSSCAKLSPSAAAAQGTAAASDAVERAAAVGIGPGSPIYFDMESYTRTSSATNATMTFLAAWTTRLHALGYESGVYSSSASGIADLAVRYGTGYQEPDDLWIANWNGSQSTSDPFVPASAWSDHQRIHQYRGGHDETYGGVTINIDNDYVEGATVGTSSSTSTEGGPKGRLEGAGSPRPGQVRVVGWTFDPSSPGDTVSLRAYVGGKPGRPGAVRYELGPAAAQPRADVAAAHRAAGANHGFDVSFATVKSGPQRVCVYAIGVEPGADKLLGCRTVGVPVAISIRRIRARGNLVRVAVRCEWPAGTQCPGQILLRARVRVRVPGRHRGRGRARTRVVRRAIAQRPFNLTGETSHAFTVRLNGLGRALLRRRSKAWAQLVVAIPGGRRTHALKLRRPG